MPTISVDATSASEISQRYNVIVHSIYSPGSADRNVALDRADGSLWSEQACQETGGETFSLSTSNPVSFKPYLETLQKLFNNQYYLVFRAVPKNKGGLQYVKVETQPKTKLLAPNNVWVPGAGESE